MDANNRTSERGQLLVVFAMALVGIIGAVGLVIDGSSTYVQRRDEQNAADAAAMAAGYAYLAGVDITATAQTMAAANGYPHGVDGTVVAVSQSGMDITVTVTSPHQNYFSGLLGLASWNVSATATVRAGVANGVYGAMPLIFNQDALANQDPDNPVSFDEPPVGTEDVPQDGSTFNWTIYCTGSGTDCNGDSNGVEDLINSEGSDTTIYLDDEIGPLNAGSHTTLFDDLAQYVGTSWPVGIVDDNGALVGWAWFHITGSVGGETKQVSGYFSTEINAAPMAISTTHGIAISAAGSYSVDLIN